MMLLGQEQTSVQLFNPVIQAGFAGFCALLLGIIVWLFKQLISLQRETNDVIAKNSAVVEKVHESTDKQVETMGSIRDLLLSRPCMKDHSK